MKGRTQPLQPPITLGLQLSKPGLPPRNQLLPTRLAQLLLINIHRVSKHDQRLNVIIGNRVENGEDSRNKARH